MLVGMLAHLKLVGLAKKKDRMAGDFTSNERRLVEVPVIGSARDCARIH